MFGLPGTTFCKLPVPRKPVLNVSGLTLEKSPAGGAVRGIESLRIQFLNITSTCNLVWCSSHDMGLTWLFITLNIELLLSILNFYLPISMRYVHYCCSWERGVQY